MNHEVLKDDQANQTLVPFGIAYLAGPVFYPPPSYVVPPSFVVALPSFVFAPSSSFVALEVGFFAPPPVATALPLTYVAVIHFSWTSAHFLLNLVQSGVERQSKEYKKTCLH